MENKGTVNGNSTLGNVTAKLGANLSIILYALIILIPMTMVFLTTFKNTTQMYADPMGLPETWSLENYLTLFQSNQMFVYFGNSVIVTAVCVTSVLVLASMVSYAIIRMPKWWGGILFGLFSLGMMIPTQVNMISQYLLLDRLNLIDTRLGLFFVTIATLLPIGVFILTGFMKTLPKGLIEAAMMDGASHWTIYSRIVIPLSLPAMATLAIFGLVIVWNDLLFPLLILKTKSLQTMPLALLNFQGEYLTNYPMIFSGVVIATTPMIVAYVFLQRYFIAGMTAGSLKG